MYQPIFRQIRKQLSQTQSWLGLAAEYAEARGFDVDVLVNQRLAPDQLGLARQVQIACDTIKLGAFRLTGKEAVSQADDETTIAQLRARIGTVLEYIDSFTTADFEGLDDRTVTQSRWKGQVMSAHDYLLEYMIPNAYFHMNHVYAILRHNGVPLGKKHYLGALSKRDA